MLAEWCDGTTSRANILGGQPLSADVQRAMEKMERAVKSAEKQLEIGSSVLARENILGGARIQPEDISTEPVQVRRPAILFDVVPSHHSAII